MIGLLIISHSAQIARGVKELADQMTKGQVPIGAAGGTIEGDLGTSTDLIHEAIVSLGQASEVLVFVDMGSAVMSAEMALEQSGLPHRITGAPLVEGTLVAAIEATRPGSTLVEIAAAAERALEAKGISPVGATEQPPQEQAGGALETTLTVKNKVGLHMRPAKEFVQLANRFSCTIRARNLSRPERPDGNAKSMIDIMKLGVSQGQQLLLSAEGDDAQAALAALSNLVEANFGE